MPDDDFNKIRDCKIPRREPPAVRLGATVWASVERNELEAMRAEITSLRAALSRARELAKRIGEAEKDVKRFRNEMCDAETDERYEKAGASLKVAIFDARDARRELLAMFGEGK